MAISNMSLMESDKQRLDKICDESIEEVTLEDLENLKDYWDDLMNSKKYYRADAVEYVFENVSSNSVVSNKIKESANSKLRSMYWGKQLKGVV